MEIAKSCLSNYKIMNYLRIFKDLKVFIVDDDYFCSNVYKQELSYAGFINFYLFKNGEECLKNISLLPDIIVLDYDMANLDGLQVIKIIKKMYPFINLVMVSGKKEKEVAFQAIENGAAAFIRKDGNELEQLNQAASRIVAKYQHHFSLSKHLQYPAKTA